MTDTRLERVLARDRVVVSIALALITTLAWIYILRLARDMDMPGMNMTGWRMASSGLRMVMAPAQAPWTAVQFVLMAEMWAVMMVGMMTPSAAPLILLYARVGRQAAAEGKPFGATGWFAGGYLFAWTIFAVAATMGQWVLERAALLTPMMASASATFGAAVLIAAGAYQWSRIKDVCLVQCQSPLAFLQRHGGFRGGARGAFGLGARHGAYCVGCCWVLMLLLFVGGVMNIAWVAMLAILVLLEKVTPVGRAVARVSGAGLVAAGAWILLASR